MSKLIIFDLDGTLLNTLQDLTNSVNYAMDELGLARYNVGQVRMMIGNGVAKLMERAVGSGHLELSDKALKMQRQYYSEHVDDFTEPYGGICQMLALLKDNGFIVAVHTNKDEDCAKKLCRHHFGNLIDYVCGTTDKIVKPDPQKAERLLSSLNVDKCNAVYCGDSDVDLMTAANLGVKCISVTWGYRDKDFLKNAGAKYFADTPRKAAETALKLC